MKSVEELMEEWRLTFIKKNADYGSAFTKIGDIIKILSDGKEIQLKTPKDIIIFTILTRTLEKTCRLFNLYFIADKKNIAESLIETAGDNGVYQFMIASEISDEEDPIPLVNIKKTEEIK